MEKGEGYRKVTVQRCTHLANFHYVFQAFIIASEAGLSYIDLSAKSYGWVIRLACFHRYENKHLRKRARFWS